MKQVLDSVWIRKTSLIISYFLIIVIGLVDFITGFEYAFSVFYVLPIYLVAWYSTFKTSIIACVFSAIVWLVADTSAGHTYSNSLIPYWNTLIRFSFYIIIAYLLFALRSALDQEKVLSLTDYLTGASNSRRFYETVQIEISRLERNQRPFTIAYLDIDNFKTINDTFGHNQGDLVLKAIVNSLQ